MAPTLVPFGKYKGQPVEALAQDREYCEWLAGQEWFRTRFTTIHAVRAYRAALDERDRLAMADWGQAVANRPIDDAAWARELERRARIERALRDPSSRFVKPSGGDR